MHPKNGTMFVGLGLISLVLFGPTLGQGPVVKLDNAVSYWSL